nr:integrase, catalytic region, zinc finger, CCHC-type, peptidase aspartic, catalytic [Tanacetum cinerariifolium]
MLTALMVTMHVPLTQWNLKSNGFQILLLCLAGYPDLFMVCQLRLFQAHDRKSKASHQFRQFCDSDLEVAFRRNACFIRNLEGVDLLKGDRSTNLCTINLHEIASVSPICLMRLHLLYMDLCGPMRIASINGKRYVLVIVDDYSRYTWVHFLRSKDEAPVVIITFLKRIMVLLQSPVIIIRTDNGTEFKNQLLKVYFDSVGISHQMSSVRTPQQNGVVERRNRTLVDAARTMLIFSRAPTPYELINGRKPDISFLHVFGTLCYPKNDREDIGKLGAKGDIGFFIGYSADSCAYRIYNRQTKKIMETMNVSFDELSAMAFKQRSSKPGLQSMTSGHVSSGLDLNYAPSTITKEQPTEDELDLLFEAMYDDYFGGQPLATVENVPPVQELQVRQTSTASTTIADNKHKANVSKNETQKEYWLKVSKSKNVGPRESLATPKPRKPRFLLRWSPTGKMFDSAGKLVAPSGCSKHMTENLKLLINFVWKFMGTVRFGNDHVAAILGFGDLQWGNILITRVYF